MVSKKEIPPLGESSLERAREFDDGFAIPPEGEDWECLGFPGIDVDKFDLSKKGIAATRKLIEDLLQRIAKNPKVNGERVACGSLLVDAKGDPIIKNIFAARPEQVFVSTWFQKACVKQPQGSVDKCARTCKINFLS